VAMFMHAISSESGALRAVRRAILLGGEARNEAADRGPRAARRLACPGLKPVWPAFVGGVSLDNLASLTLALRKYG
jgi:hypothetical protein